MISRSQITTNVRDYERLRDQARAAGRELEIFDDVAYAKIMGQPVPETTRTTADDGVFTDLQGRRWLIGYRASIINSQGETDVRMYEALKAKAAELGAQLSILPDSENPNPPAA